MARTRRKKTWPFILVFLLGFVLMMYPLISDYYYRIDANHEIEEFQEGAKKLDDVEVLRRIELARAYNKPWIPQSSGTLTRSRRRKGSPSMPGCWRWRRRSVL